MDDGGTNSGTLQCRLLMDDSRSSTGGQTPPGNTQGSPLSPRRDLSESCRRMIIISIEFAISLLLYLIIGGFLVHSYIKDFKIIHSPDNKEEQLVDVLYFLVVTLFTIGYGDFVPNNEVTKVLTSFLILFGCGFVVRFTDLVDCIWSRLEAFVIRGVDEKKKKKKVYFAFLVIIICIVIGIAGAYGLEALGFVDSLYLSIISMTTVGYGDISFVSKDGRFFAIFWLPLNVLVNNAFAYLAEHVFSTRNWINGLLSKIRRIFGLEKNDALSTSEMEREITVEIGGMVYTSESTFKNGDTVYTSASTFEDLNLSPQVLKGLYVKMGFKEPNKIQAITLPMILTDPYKDLIAQAHSGSGKTTSFVLGMLSRVDPKLKVPQALCICPTREVAIQNREVLRKMGKYTGIQCVVPAERTSFTLSQSQASPVSAQVVCGTPCTIKEWMSIKMLDVRRVLVLVFDEADRILAEEGFKEDSLKIKQDIEKINPQCQVILFSATFNEVVTNFVSRMVKGDHNKVCVSEEELSLKAVKQYKVYCSDEQTKIEMIKTIIFEMGENLGQGFIFVQTENCARMLHQKLTSDDYSVTTILGVLTAKNRDKIVKEFKDGLTQVLISTELLARVFDQQQVNFVVNYDLPIKDVASPSIWERSEPDYEVYLRRIGRVGRFGRKGAVFNFICEYRDELTLSRIEQNFNIYMPEASQTKDRCCSTKQTSKKRTNLLRGFITSKIIVQVKSTEEAFEDALNVESVMASSASAQPLLGQGK